MSTERVSNLTGPERETIANTDDDAEVVRIWTAQRRHITRLRNHRAFTEVESGYHGTTEWAAFTIPADQWNPATGAKRQSSMSGEQRAAAADRLRAAREANA